MDIFLLLLGKILPLYLIIAAGYFAGQKLKVSRESISVLVIYMIVPVVFFGATAQMPIQHEYLLLPFALFALTLVLGLGFYKLSGFIWKDGRRNLTGYMMGTANQGYFGIPVFLALFGPQHLGLYVFIGLGISIYEGTFGYYLMARGSYTVRESLMRLLRLPLIPAALLGLSCSAMGWKLPPAALEIYTVFKGAYTVLGMMIIGLGLSAFHHLWKDIRFTSFILVGKFLCWPILTLAMLAVYGWATPVEPVVRQIFLLLSLMPIAANSVAFATHLRVEPDKAATIVLLSTVVALFYIPLVMSLVY
jgi:predicted permease